MSKLLTNEQILAAFNFRHASKLFDSNKKIPAEDLNTIAEAARLSPSSFGFEPWQFVWVKSPEHRAELQALALNQPQITSASDVVINLHRKGKAVEAHSNYILQTMREDLGIPDLVVGQLSDFHKMFYDNLFTIDSEDRHNEWSRHQTYLPMANMMTVAALLGIDSCPLEGFEKAKVETWLANISPFNTEEFGVAHLTAFGYRAAEPSRSKVRRSADKVFYTI